jgi:hypothetical protein
MGIYEVDDWEFQVRGVDLVLARRVTIQVKCDYNAGNAGTGNLYIQTKECNLFKHT